MVSVLFKMFKMKMQKVRASGQSASPRGMKVWTLDTHRYDYKPRV